MFSLKQMWNGVKACAAKVEAKVLSAIGTVTGGIATALGLSAPQPANAVIDVTAVTTGISDAQTAVLAIITALLGLSVAIFGIVKVYNFVHRKSGA